VDLIQIANAVRRSRFPPKLLDKPDTCPALREGPAKRRRSQTRTASSVYVKDGVAGKNRKGPKRLPTFKPPKPPGKR